ncbi:MAG: YbaB/EbfC family nucleoid-associated protein [Bacilli bacterium]
MNIQAMMKQAQKLQKDMMTAKEELEKKIYEGNSSFLTIKENGKKEIIEVKLNIENIENEEIEMLQDMILVVVNDINKKIDKEMEAKLGQYTQGLPGLF